MILSLPPRKANAHSLGLSRMPMRGTCSGTVISPMGEDPHHSQAIAGSWKHNARNMIRGSLNGGRVGEGGHCHPIKHGNSVRVRVHLECGTRCCIGV